MNPSFIAKLSCGFKNLSEIDKTKFIQHPQGNN